MIAFSAIASFARINQLFLISNIPQSSFYLEEYKKKKEEAENAKSGKISRAPTYDLKDKRKKDLSNTDIKY